MMYVCVCVLFVYALWLLFRHTMGKDEISIPFAVIRPSYAAAVTTSVGGRDSDPWGDRSKPVRGVHRGIRGRRRARLFHDANRISE